MYILLIAACFTSTTYSFHCNEGGPGKFCSVDLKGYHDCQRGSSTFHKCHGTTRCSCFLNKNCPDPSNICKPYAKPRLLIEDFVLQYFGTRRLTTPTRQFNDRIHGVIRQDNQGQRMFKDEYIGSTRSFVLIIPYGNTFKKYEGTYPKLCKSSTINKFEGYMSELGHFTRTESLDLRSSITKETWEFETGRRNLGQIKINWKWVVKANWATGTMEPVEYNRNFYGSANVKYTELIHLDRFDFSKGVKHDAWYQVPGICN